MKDHTMATAIKTNRTLVAAGTINAAGGATTGATWNLTTALGGVLTAQVTNGSTGPAVGCDLVVQVSGDGVNWKEYVRQTAAPAASAVTSMVVELPTSILYARPVFQGNTGQAVTVEAFGQEFTSIG